MDIENKKVTFSYNCQIKVEKVPRMTFRNICNPKVVPIVIPKDCKLRIIPNQYPIGYSPKALGKGTPHKEHSYKTLPEDNLK